MNPHNLQDVQPGFADEALDSQAVFRATLHALAHPGRPTPVPALAPTPSPGHPAAARVLLALLDAECTLWLSPRLGAGAASAWLRFHTGCRIVSEPEQAQFLWVAAGDALPSLASLNLGSDADPELSTTVLLEVADWQGGNPLQWRGPGVAGARTLAVQGLTDTFLPQWHYNHAAFPRGVDLLLASAEHIVGLPRSSQLSRTPQPQEA